MLTRVTREIFIYVIYYKVISFLFYTNVYIILQLCMNFLIVE